MKLKLVSRSLVIFINTAFDIICVLVLDKLMIKNIIPGILSFHGVRSTPVLSLETPVSQGFAQADAKSKNKWTSRNTAQFKFEGKFISHPFQRSH